MRDDALPANPAKPCWMMSRRIQSSASMEGRKLAYDRLKETTMWYSAVGCIVTRPPAARAAPTARGAPPVAARPMRCGGHPWRRVTRAASPAAACVTVDAVGIKVAVEGEDTAQLEALGRRDQRRIGKVHGGIVILLHECPYPLPFGGDRDV
jgi:hypothetical protein